MSTNGFDTTTNTASLAATIQAAGYAFVGRYLSQSSWKRITPAEAKALKAAGLGIVLVYEDGPTAPSYFNPSRGHSDAVRAIAQAVALGAPPGTTLYFAVDYDASNADITGPITAYFQGVATTLAADPNGYASGVY